MATTADQPGTAPKGRRRPRSTEPFGGAVAMASLAILVTLIGFWRTYFSILSQVDLAHMVHGASSTGWLVLVLGQAALIRNRSYKWHRVIGWSSLLLFAVLLVSSWHMLALMLSGRSGVPFAFAKLFALSDVTAVPLMILAYGAAIVLRKDRHVHSRLISVTLLAGLLPAVARMFNLVWRGPEGLVFAMHPTYLFVLAILAAVIVVDWRNDRLRWPFPLAFAWFAVAYATLFPAWQSQWFDDLAKVIAVTY